MFEDQETLVLIRKVQAGDAAARDELFSRYLPRVVAAVRCRLGAELRRKVESWDLVQDVMIECLKGLPDFEPRNEGAFLHWLGQVALNRIRDANHFYKAGKRDMRKEQPFASDRSVDADFPLNTGEHENRPTPSEVVGLAEDLARLEVAIDQLPDDERELIVSRKIEGRSFEDLAQEHGTTPDAIRMRVNRAMAKLVQVFQEGERT